MRSLVKTLYQENYSNQDERGESHVWVTFHSTKKKEKKVNIENNEAKSQLQNVQTHYNDEYLDRKHACSIICFCFLLLYISFLFCYLFI